MFTEESIQKLMKVLSEILSEKYGCKITMTARLKDEYAEGSAQEDEQSKDNVPKAS